MSLSKHHLFHRLFSLLENGYINGAMNIPLDELRNRLDELSKDETLYVNCQVGLRDT
ncbi:hypothetical protein GCM10008986_32810 [Salinibacillus aidingensis]|uniref:Rhodanese domain-containing protein n=1 Tax=Salinibacillus aidingensis TaxID=237684 RepID=A0ABN1BPL8_9BACI